ncbi:MAG: FtsX-like permease family protein [Bacteroidia bacterium]|nr:FtsX-like permease family protein [Bacteroidia bacterium]
MPQSAVITEEMATLFFGTANPVGDTFYVGKQKTPYQVTGVVYDDARPSHMKAKIWLSHTSQWQPDTKYWTSAAGYNYFLLKENAHEQDLRRALDQILEQQVYPTAGTYFGKTLEEFKANDNALRFSITSLTDIYLRAKAVYDLSPGGNEANMKIFAGISIFILCLAAANFINLSTARATRRAKEVGVRKTLGSSKRMLVMQFLHESVTMSWIAMVLALGLVELFLLVFHWISGELLSVNIWSSGVQLLVAFTFTTCVGLAAGAYPSFYLASFKPVEVLKGTMKTGRRFGFRETLVVFQFVISIALIVSTTIILRQLSFMKDKDLGFDPANVLTIDHADVLGSAKQTFVDELSVRSEVKLASLHGGEPGSKSTMSYMSYQSPQVPDAMAISTYYGDANYLDLMGFRLLSGRTFRENVLSDTASVILNESAAKALGLPDDPVGARLNDNMEVIGMVSDFHWESLRTRIAPLAIMLHNPNANNFGSRQAGFRLQGNDLSGFLATAERTWKKYNQEEPFRYHWLDDNFGAILVKERVFGKACLFFTMLAIAISCLGLLGLSAFVAEQRTKEIGIRKVMGASTGTITRLLNSQFSKLVILATLLSLPLTWWLMDQWLQSFAYHIKPAWFDFAGGALAALTIAWITVSYHAVKAARSNPVEVLRAE